MDFKEIKQRLSVLDTACVSDANKALRVIDPAIRPIRRGLKLIGRAHTVSCHEDFLMVIKALKDAEEGEVIVIDSQGSKRALAGEMFPTEAMRKHLAGIVIDGPCRDTASIRRMDIPYYARSVNCRAGTTKNIFKTQIPINCGGVAVDPGDIVFGDDDGLIVATIDELADVIDVAEEIQKKEERLLEGMASGVSLLEMMNFDDHYEKLSNGESSTLKFF
jgi:RraA family protein